MKFLLTVAVVALVWFGFQYLQRLSSGRGGRAPTPRRHPDHPRFEPVADGESVQDLIRCPRCSTYRSAKLGHCGQDGCPY